MKLLVATKCKTSESGDVPTGAATVASDQSPSVPALVLLIAELAAKQENYEH